MILPKVSIILVTYNRAHLIGEAIESVLKQTFNAWELIIINGASTDNSEEIIGSYSDKESRIIYIHRDKRYGVSKDRNFGLSLAKGKYIAVLDSDDFWIDDKKLEKQIGFLSTNPEYILIGGGVVDVDEHGDEIRRYKNPLSDVELRKMILFRNPFVHSAVLFRREAALLAGGYDESIVIGEEYSLWLRMGLNGKFANLDDYLTAYRIHQNGAVVSCRFKGALDTKKIIQKYNGKYPNFSKAMIKAYLRILYSFYLISRDYLKYKIFRQV